MTLLLLLLMMMMLRRKMGMRDDWQPGTR